MRQDQAVSLYIPHDLSQDESIAQLVHTVFGDCFMLLVVRARRYELIHALTGY
jgi:hypothetical protein